MAGKVGMKHYDKDFRMTVVDLHLNKGWSLHQLEGEFDIHDTQILNWCKWYKLYGTPFQQTGKVRGRPKKNFNDQSEKIKRLEMEIALLKKFNELLMVEEAKRR